MAASLATKCETGLAYTIGQAPPLMQTIETFGTGTVSEQGLYDLMDTLLVTSVKGIVTKVGLQQPIYIQAAAYAHLGKKDVPW